MQNKKFYEFNLIRYKDERGCLTSFEFGKNLPFGAKRVYYLSNMNEKKQRACHAHKQSQRVLTVLQGGCKVNLNDGKDVAELDLSTPDKAIYFNNSVWCELKDFKPNTIIMAISDMPYFEEEYIRNYEEFSNFVKDKEKDE